MTPAQPVELPSILRCTPEGSWPAEASYNPSGNLHVGGAKLIPCNHFRRPDGRIETPKGAYVQVDLSAPDDRIATLLRLSFPKTAEDLLALVAAGRISRDSATRVAATVLGDLRNEQCEGGKPGPRWAAGLVKAFGLPRPRPWERLDFDSPPYVILAPGVGRPHKFLLCDPEDLSRAWDALLDLGFDSPDLESSRKGWIRDLTRLLEKSPEDYYSETQRQQMRAAILLLSGYRWGGEAPAQERAA